MLFFCGLAAKPGEEFCQLAKPGEEIKVFAPVGSRDHPAAGKKLDIHALEDCKPRGTLSGTGATGTTNPTVAEE